MSKRLAAAIATAALAAAVAAAAAPAATVELTVESAVTPSPLFAGTVTTEPHPVDGGDGSGPHACAGPAGAAPRATATGALDDALRSAGIEWRGNWDPSFQDFFIDRIGPHASAPPDRYWSISVNGRFSAGGCLAAVESGDSVRFHYGTPPPEPVAEPPPGTGTAGPRGGQSPTADGGPQPDVPRGRLAAIARRAGDFLRGTDAPVGADWGRLALALRAGRRLAPAAAAIAGGRLDERSPDGSVRGDVNATALAAIAVRADRGEAVRWLRSVQRPDGGFGYRAGAPPDVDTTGLVAWALARGGASEAAHRAGVFIAAAQGPDGGFPNLPGGASNAQSTGLALIGLRASGIGPRPRSGAARTPLAYLAALARRDGSIAYAPGLAPTPAWTTAQALLGLTGRQRLLG